MMNRYAITLAAALGKAELTALLQEAGATEIVVRDVRRRGTTRERIVAALASTPRCSAELAAEAGVGRARAYQILRELSQAGRITRLAHGWYCAGPVPADFAPKRLYRAANGVGQWRLPEKLITALAERPMSQLDMSKALGVTRERARQIAVKALALGLIVPTERGLRVGIKTIYALPGATYSQAAMMPRETAAVLSTFPRTGGLMERQVIGRAKLRLGTVRRCIAVLMDLGLVAKTRHAAHAIYFVTPAGTAHPCYRGNGEPAPVQIIGDQLKLLMFLSEHGPMRVPEIRERIRAHMPSQRLQRLINLGHVARDRASGWPPVYRITEAGETHVRQIRQLSGAGFAP